jgi:hypothetical protein
MIDPLIHWLTASRRGYGITSRGLQLASKWYTDDGRLVTNNIDDMVALLYIAEEKKEIPCKRACERH